MQKAVFVRDVDDRKFSRGARLTMILGLGLATWIGIIGLVAEFG